jgi:hypothetical protein
MAEEKMVSIGKMDEILNDYYPESVTVDFHGLEIAVQRIASLGDIINAAKAVVSGCYDQDGEYVPYMRDYLTRAAVFQLYTNIRLPENPNHLNRMLYCGELWDLVYNNIEFIQLAALQDAIDDAVSVRNDANRVLFETEIRRAISSMENISDQFAQIFEGLTSEDLKALVGAIANGGIDEERLVSAVVREQNALREQPALEVIEGGSDGE